MEYKQIIAESWKYTQEHKKLVIWLGFLPAVFTTAVGVFTLIYQFFAFKQSYLFTEGGEGILKDIIVFIWDFITTHISLTLPLVIVGIIFALFYFLFPTLARAAAIQAIARNRNGQEAGVGVGIRYGIMSYLPLFEYHLLIKTFAFFSILTEMSFVIRNLGMDLFQIFLPIFFLFILISFLLTLLFTYSDFYIVIDGNGVFEAMKKSAKLVITNWKHTFLVTVLMLIIGVRIVIQVVLVFLIPALVILTGGYIATVALPVTGLIIGGVVGAAGLIIASYLNGVVDIFAYSVWTFTFLSLTSEKQLSARDVISAREVAGKEEPSAPPFDPALDHKNLA